MLREAGERVTRSEKAATASQLEVARQQTKIVELSNELNAIMLAVEQERSLTAETQSVALKEKTRMNELESALQAIEQRSSEALKTVTDRLTASENRKKTLESELNSVKERLVKLHGPALDCTVSNRITLPN